MDDSHILSVGIDLGTSTTQLVLARLTIKNFASAFSVPRINIAKKEIIYRSQIIFTPLLSQTEVDSESIKHFVAHEYQKAGIDKHQIQMGAVIITGETARKDNAEAVTKALSQYAGDFVVATAGPDLESVIAGKGAGTNVTAKEKRHQIVNIDVGGGTSNLGLFDEDDAIDTACFDIGGRIVKLGADHRVAYISTKAQTIIDDLSLNIKVGAPLTIEDAQPLIDELVLILNNSIGLGTKSKYYDLFITNHPLQVGHQIDGVTFSGGVADCIYNDHSDPFEYGDIGVLLGRALKASPIFTEKTVYPSVETIRATVVGAGSHTTDVTGSTIEYQNGILPIRNLPVLKLSINEETAGKQKLEDSIRNKISWFSSNNELNNVVLAVNGKHSPAYQEVVDYSEAIIKGAQVLIQNQKPLIVAVTEDMAKALGHCLRSELPHGYPFICIDSVKVENGDYIDLGEPVAGGEVLPVIVKTLVFG